MIKRLLLILFAVMGSSVYVSAQEEEIEDKLQARVKAKADERYDEYSFSPAIDIYKKVLDKGFTSPDLLKRLANSYYFNAKYEEAANIYKKLVETYPDDTEADYFFRYAQSLKTLGEYEESAQVMAKFKEMASSLEVDFDEDYLDKIEANSGRYDIEPFKYNSKYSDFAASYYEKGLIFASDRGYRESS